MGMYSRVQGALAKPSGKTKTLNQALAPSSSLRVSTVKHAPEVETLDDLESCERAMVRNHAETQAISRVPEGDRGAVLSQVAASGRVTAKAIRAVAAGKVIEVIALGKVIDVKLGPAQQVAPHCSTCTCAYVRL